MADETRVSTHTKVRVTRDYPQLPDGKPDRANGTIVMHVDSSPAVTIVMTRRQALAHAADVAARAEEL